VVKIITGKMNSSKTTRMVKNYNEEKTGDGIISKKIMIDKDVFGYKACRLSDNLEFPFMIHEKFYKKELSQNRDIVDNEFSTQIGPYMIYKRAMKKVNSIYKELIKKKVTPLYFDEIGKLEIQGDGFYKMLKKAIKMDIDVVLTIREDLIDDLVDKLNISNYEVLGGW